MSTRNQWLQGLQWGALLWLPYVAFVACRDCSYTGVSDIVDLWGRGAWHPATYWLLAPGWLAVIVLLAAGSRWTRLVVALLLCAHVPVAFGVVSYSAAVCARFLGSDAACDSYSVWSVFMPLLLPVLPLAVLRVEEPRVVLALVALGRFREALARFGGVGTLLVAAAVVSTYDAAWEYMVRPNPLLLCCIPTAALMVLAAGVMWMEHRRRPATTTGC